MRSGAFITIIIENIRNEWRDQIELAGSGPITLPCGQVRQFEPFNSLVIRLDAGFLMKPLVRTLISFRVRVLNENSSGIPGTMNREISCSFMDISITFSELICPAKL